MRDHGVGMSLAHIAFIFNRFYRIGTEVRRSRPGTGQPPTPRLAVPPPGNALLPDAASRQFAGALVAGLQTQEVPAVADQVRKNDWQLVTSAEQRGANVVPRYSVLNPKGEDKGKTEGSPVPTEAWAAAAPAT